jgi:Zn-dependent peptidase ImmA (M78 family)
MFLTLSEIAEQQDLPVYYYPFKNPKQNGLYVKNNRPYIIINSELTNNPVQHWWVLAEEIGHHLTGAQSNILTDNTVVGRIKIQIDEYKARLWAEKYFKQLLITNASMGAFPHLPK